MKVFVVVALHGEEVFGLKVAGKIQLLHNDDFMIRVGHPEAVAKGQRYIEKDLNRSFRVDQKSVEASLAHGILREINTYNPDYIIDIHTSVSNVRQVAIVAQYCEKTEYLSRTLGMDSMVVMPRRFNQNSLIGCFPDKAISIEFGKNQRSDKLAANLANRCNALDVDFVNTGSLLPVFEAVTTIEKDFTGLANIVNLEFNHELGGYPFLAGKDTYSSIGGFLTKKIV